MVLISWDIAKWDRKLKFFRILRAYLGREGRLRSYSFPLPDLATGLPFVVGSVFSGSLYLFYHVKWIDIFGIVNWNLFFFDAGDHRGDGTALQDNATFEGQRGLSKLWA